MNIRELKRLPKYKWGKFIKNNVTLEPHEEDAAIFLTKYGFVIDTIRPTNTPKVRNADFLIGDTIWEMKTPISSNKKTIKKRIHKVSEQASHIIFDLRKVNSNSSEVVKELVDRFQDNTKLKKMVLIIDDEKVLEFSKK